MEEADLLKQEGTKPITATIPGSAKCSRPGGVGTKRSPGRANSRADATQKVIGAGFPAGTKGAGFEMAGVPVVGAVRSTRIKLSKELR